MSKLNKLVTNYPVSLSEEEVENLSATLAPVVAACGGGGGTGGKIYTGIGFVNVNNTNNQIGLTNEANTKLNQDIPTKVSDLTDSASYQTVAGMTNYLTTATYEADSATFLTQTSASQNLAPISVTADVEALKAASGDFSEYYQKTDTSSKSQLSAKFNQYAKQADLITTISLINGKQDELTFGYDENNAISSIDDHEIAGTGGTTGDYYSASNPSGFITSSVSELDNFYSKTDTSSKTELQTKFDSLLDYNVTAAAGIEVTTATDVGIKTFGISMTAQPVVTDTRLSGYNGIAAEPDGNVSGLWDVGLTQDMLNTINGKLDSTVAAQTYQPKGDYVSSTDITDMATKTWVEQKNYLTQVPSEYVTDTELQTTLSDYATNTLVQNTSANITALIPSTAGLASETDLQIVSAGVDYVSANAITAHQSLTNYYTKSETSGASEIENALTGKQDKLTFAGESNTITSINNSAVGGGTSFTGVTTAGSISGDGLTNPLGLVTSAEQALSAVANKLEPPPHNTQQSTNYIWSDPLGQGIPGWIDANNWLDEALENTEFLHAEDLRWYISPENGVSGKWDNEEEELKLGIDTTNMAANKQYAFTTTGWAEVQAGTSFTGVVTGTGLSGTGLSNSPLGIDTGASIYFTNGSAKSAISADKAASASASKRLQSSTAGPVIQAEDVTALQNWASSNSSTWEGVTAKLGTAQYALDSATFYTTSNTAGYLTKTVADTYYQPTGSYATSAGLTAGNQYAMTTNGWASVETAYLPLTGGTVTGQMTLTGTGWENRLTIGRSNTAIDIGVASNGALTLKANINNACQFNMMQTGTSGVDINITYGQTPSAIGNLYVMKTHTIADATTASGSWNGDNLLHIILDS